MADTKKNAIAKLAEQLKNGYVSLVVNDKQVATFATAAFPELDKAQRILAELAKVETWNDDNSPRIRSLIDCFDECRTIAEEGV